MRCLPSPPLAIPLVPPPLLPAVRRAGQRGLAARTAGRGAAGAVRASGPIKRRVRDGPEINGDDLSAWHNRADWKAKEQTANKSPVRYLGGKEMAVMRMVATAINTVAQANGKIVEHTAKVKINHFENEASFKEYVEALIDAQDSVCALSGLVLQFDGEYDDQENVGFPRSHRQFTPL